MLTWFLKYFDHQVAIHGMHDDEQKFKTHVCKRSREPHWEDEEFVFQIRGEVPCF